jgi:hypothetical protein
MSDEAIDAAFRDDIPPLFSGAEESEDTILVDRPPLFAEE